VEVLLCGVLLLLNLRSPQEIIDANATCEMAQGPDRSLRGHRVAQFGKDV
jgi:hypothetical protein